MTPSKPQKLRGGVSGQACASSRSLPRQCAVCGAQAPTEGPLPHVWDCHLVVTGVRASGGAETAMQMSCSAKCRAVKGWRERREVGNVG